MAPGPVRRRAPRPGDWRHRAAGSATHLTAWPPAAHRAWPAPHRPLRCPVPGAWAKRMPSPCLSTPGPLIAPPPRAEVTNNHNRACGASRNRLALMRRAGIAPVVIEDLKTPPSQAPLRALVAACHRSPRRLATWSTTTACVRPEATGRQPFRQWPAATDGPPGWPPHSTGAASRVAMAPMPPRCRRPRPLRLPAYIATSARLSSSAALRPSSGASA